MIEAVAVGIVVALAAVAVWYWRQQRSDAANEAGDRNVAPLLDDGDLPGALRSLDRNLESIGYRMDRKFVRNLTVMVVGLVLAFIAIAVAWSSGNDAAAANQRAGRAERALAEYKAATAEARVGSCEQYNLQQDVQIVAEITQSHDLVTALARGIKDPASRERQVTAYNQKHDAIIRSGHPHRDCTPAGIAEYLRGIPRPEATSAVPSAQP